MYAEKKVSFEGKQLTYNAEKSRRTIVPIYQDVDGQLYMPLNQRFVTINQVVAVLDAYMHRKICAG